jgi:antigen flippase
MGGAAVVTLILGMIRMKFAAVLIGTTGTGLYATFTAMQGFIGAIAGLGIKSSAVREIAVAYAKNDKKLVGETVLSLRRICWLTGLMGALSMLFFSSLLSEITFTSTKYQWDIAALGLIILFANLSGGQTALLQGARKIADLAKAQVVGAVAGSLISVCFYFWLGLRGIVPALVLMAAVQLLISWYFAKRLPVPTVEMTWGQSFKKTGSMVKLGMVLMWTGLMSSAVDYATILLITKRLNVEAVGIYSAAYALSGIFVKFVLSAMSTDFYPRLAAVADDHVKVNRLINEQTEIGLLLALPGLLATVIFAPWIVQVFYTKEFLPAVELIQWFILGCLGRVVAWPLGFLMLALGKGKWYLITETAAQVSHMILIVICLELWGLKGVALAFFFLYVFYTFLVLVVGRVLTKFYWSAVCLRLIALAVASLMLGLAVGGSESSLFVAGFGIAMMLITAVLCLRGLTRRLGEENRFVQKIDSVSYLKKLFRD